MRNAHSVHRPVNNSAKPSSAFVPLITPPPLPRVSAKCWAVLDAKSGEILWNKKGNRRREIASLTKMMTCLCVCKLIKQFDIDPKDIYIQVSKASSFIRGTSANLQKGDVLTIWDLMHGMMLPSGNDAALSLAESFGTYIYLKSEKCKERTKKDASHPNQKVKEPVRYFLDLMNKTAIELRLRNTFYANSHGLCNVDSYSTANDQAKLTFEVLKWPTIMEIVNKKFYSCEIEQGNGSIREAIWENTNKLLGTKGWQGVKTGVTTVAGPSLSAYYQDEKDAYIIILLGSCSMDIRWAEAVKLVAWTNKQKKEKIQVV